MKIRIIWTCSDFCKIEHRYRWTAIVHSRWIYCKREIFGITEGKTEVRPEEFQCAMCKKFFKYNWSEEEAIAEARAHGVNLFDSVTVCDDCYEKTPLRQR